MIIYLLLSIILILVAIILFYLYSSSEPEKKYCEFEYNTKAYVLDYQSMSDIKTKLYNIELHNITNDCYTSAYSLTLDIQKDYNLFENNSWKDSYFDYKFNNYDINDSVREFISRVVHSISVESSNLFNWSLKDYSKDEIQDLFWEYDLDYGKLPKVNLNQDLFYVQYWYSDVGQGTVLDMSRFAEYKTFLLSKKLFNTNQDKTIDNIVEFVELNFFHAYEGNSWDNYKDGRNNISNSLFYNPLSIERYFDERIGGCQQDAILLTGMLRSINIPAVYIVLADGHGITYLSTINKYVHGDNTSDNSLIPAKYLYLSANDILNLNYLSKYDKTNEPNYSILLKEKLKDIKSQTVFLVNQERKDNYLYLDGTVYCKFISELDWNYARNQAKDFNISCDANTNTIKSSLVEIKSLDELSR